eukprot:s1634_g17.t1
MSPCVFEATLMAKRDLQKLGEDCLDDLSQPPPSGLQDAEDITQSLLIPKVERPAGPALRPSSVSVSKAMVASFQCWQSRNKEIVGLMIGVKHKSSGGTATTTVIIGRDWKQLLEDSRVKKVCGDEEASLCGVMLTKDEGDLHERAKGFLLDLHNNGVKEPVCVFAPCSDAPVEVSTGDLADIECMQLQTSDVAWRQWPACRSMVERVRSDPAIYIQDLEWICAALDIKVGCTIRPDVHEKMSHAFPDVSQDMLFGKALLEGEHDCQGDDPKQPSLLSIMREKQASAPALKEESPVPKRATADENPFLSAPDKDQSSLLEFGVADTQEAAKMTTVWCPSHDIHSLGNILRSTDINIESMGVPADAKSFAHLAGVTNQHRLWHDNLAAREFLAALHAHIPDHESKESVALVFSEVDMFLANVALGLQASQ